MIKVFPVVHLRESDVHNAFRECKYLISAGVDGVYLTDRYNKATSKVALFETLRKVQSEFPGAFIGVNMADMLALEAMQAVIRRSGDELKIPSALWIDNVQLEWENKSAVIEQKKSSRMLRKRMKLVGGIACRNPDTNYYSEDPVMALYETEWLKDIVDIVVTSGASASRAPEFEKLKSMKLATGDKPLAVSSGITLGSIDQYRGVVDEVFIHNGFETQYGSNRFDTDLVKELVGKAHSL